MPGVSLLVRAPQRMWARLSRGLRRAALLVPLLLTALALLLLPRPPPPQPAKPPPPPPSLARPLERDDDVNSKLNEVEVEELPGGTGGAGGPGEGRGGDGDADEVAKRPWFMRGGEAYPAESASQHMFPEDSPGDDRILEQLMYTLPKEEEDPPIKKILVPNGLNAWGAAGGRTEFLRNKCPVDRCSLTSDVQAAATADAILFKDYHTQFNVKRPAKQVWILYYLECPYHTSSLRATSVDVFNWTATYRRDSDIVTPYEKWVYHDPLVTEREPERNYAANKTKKVAWFVSNCHARNRRLEYARLLSRHIRVDIYGACGSHHCPRADPNCLDMLDKEYKFYLAFENSNCRDYVTEKFFVNGLQHDILPIVMGAQAPEYAAIAPYNSYIHVEEFMDPAELAGYLHRLDKDDALYNSYFKWKGTGEFINTYFFCRVCAMLHAGARRGRTTHYSDVQAWWREGACTRREWRREREPPLRRRTRDTG